MDRLVRFYRRLSTTARSVIVFVLAVSVALATMHALTFSATAITKKTGEEDPGIVLNQDPENEDFDNVSEGTGTDNPEEKPSEPAETPAAPEVQEGEPSPEPSAMPEEPGTEPEVTAAPEETGAPEETEAPEEVIIAEEEQSGAELLSEEPEEESDPTADIETAADWEKLFRDIEFTGVWADDLLAVAESQIGYRESKANFIRDEENIKRGYTRYGAWYGDAYAKWDSLFVLFSMYYTGITIDQFPFKADCEDWIEALKEKELFFEADDYVPNKGDLVFADTDEDGEADYVAIVKAVETKEGESDKLVVIEGDSGDEVKESRHEFNNPLILGYAQLPENPELAEEEEPEAEPVYASFEGKANNVEVTVLYEEGAFPEGTTMKVKPVWNPSVLGAINDTVTDKEVVKVQAVDIAFYDAEGKEIEPEKPIKVTMKSTSVPKQAEEAPVVVHVDDKMETSVVEAEQAEEAEKPTEAVTFESDAFSVYAIVYTVDFAYSLDGRAFAYSMEGGTSMKLSALVEALGIIEETSLENGKAFVAEVNNVEFTDSTLLKVKKDFFGNDWTLTSLKPFTTEETLTITMNNGNMFTVGVTDAQYTTDLNSLLTGITVKLNGTPISDGDTVTVDKGDHFDMHLEIAENDFYQFPDDATEMVYQLPDGINLGEDFTTYITINMGIDGKVYRNPLVYDKETNTLKLTWNTKDPNFKKLKATDNTKVIIDLSGYFNDNATHVEFSDDLKVDVKHEEHHDADIQKAGQLFLPGAQGNPYGNQPAIKYTVTVTSDGTTTVNVNDVVEGSAVTLDTTNWSAVSNKGTTVTPTFTEKGFTLNGQELQDGEVITFTYWGKVDTSNIENLRNVTYSQTGNKVTLTGDNIPEKEKTHYEHEVSDNKMSKSAENVGEVDKNGKQTVTWKIIANNNPFESIGGSTITDRIAADSRAYMSYSGDGIAVVAKRPDGTTVLGTTYNWNTSNLTMTDEDQDKHWTFTIPKTDEALTYEITYTTVVDTTKHPIGLFTVVNNTEGKPGTGSGSATVGKPDTPTPQPINYTKKAVSVSEEEVVWNISINIDRDDSGYRNPFVLTDYIPSHAFGDIGYTDDFESVEVEGLNDTEWYAISYNYSRRDDNAWKKSGDNVKPTDVILTFYRNGIVDGDVQNKNGQNNTANPGINATTNRTLTVKVVTKNSENWLKLAAEEGIKHQDYLEHTNKAKINEYDKVEDTVSPMAKVVYKMRDGNREVLGSTSTANVYIHVKDDLSDPTDEVKGDYPAYKFWVMVGGVTENNLTDSAEGKQLVIEDSFDPLFRILLNGEDVGKAPVRYGYGNSPTSFAEKQPDISKGESFEWRQTPDGKATFIITNPSKNGDNYYPYYAVEYWLVPKNENAYNQIKQLTLEAGGEKQFTNTANSGDSSDNLDFKYTYQVIDKSSAPETDADTGITLEKYKIEINKDKLTLNGGETMTMTDTYSANLSVDFGSINVTAIGKDGQDRSGEISWDYRGHVGTFQIPDETYVIITYSARVVGDPGSVQTVTNTAYMEGYFDTVTSERVVDLSGEGSAEKIRVRLLKFAADHMEEGLNGAKFRLFDQDKNPVVDKDGNEVVFTTEYGYLNKYGVVNAKDDHLDYVLNSSDLYDTGAYRDDLNAEGQARWDAGTIANPTGDADKLVTYGDLSEAGMKKLGVNYHAGFAEITLDQSEQGVALKKERAYYLQEVTTPVRDNGDNTVTHFDKDFTMYSFLITDQSDYTAPGGVYVYHNNDVLTVRNWPSDGSLKISKTFTGNAELSDEQKNNVTFTIQKKNAEGQFVDYPIDVWDEEQKAVVQRATVKYGDKKDAAGNALFENGVLSISGIEAGEYRVIESNQVFDEYTRSTEYLVDGVKQTVTKETESDGVSVTVTDEDVQNNAGHDIAITNSYFTNKYEVKKVAADTAEVLGNAEFKIVKINSNGTEEDVQTEIMTDPDTGKFDIKWTGNEWNRDLTFEAETLYYVVETKAPEGYVMEDPDKHYFYFSSDPASPAPETPWKPASVPDGETAVDLTTGFGSATISNRRDTEKTFVKVDKKWVNNMGQDITETMTDDEAVNVTLYRTTSNLNVGTVIDNEDEDNPKSAADTKVLTINWGDNKTTKLSFISGDRIQLTMRSTETDRLINPTVSSQDINYQIKKLVGGEGESARKVWMLTTSYVGNNPTITIQDQNNTAYSLIVDNLETRGRVYKLTQAEAEAITGKDIAFSKTFTLNSTNKWTHTVSNLELTDDNGTPYFYYTIESEADAKSTTTYDVGSKTITVTNVAPEQLEVNKKWLDSAGENITHSKTDGSITYELYQVENPLRITPGYSGQGTIGVDFSKFMKSTYNGPVVVSVGGNTDGKIIEGSKAKIEIVTTDQYNSPLTDEYGNPLSFMGCSLVSDGIKEEKDDQGNFIRRIRTIVLDNIQSTVTATGIFSCSGSTPQVTFTVLKEPADADIPFDQLKKTKIGDVTVTYNGVSFVKAATCPKDTIRVTAGTKPWSSLVYNLDKKGIGEDGKPVNYKYYVVETAAEGVETLDPNYENNPAKTGSTIVIDNQEKRGSLEITKKVTSGGMPATGTEADGTYIFVIKDASGKLASGKVKGADIVNGEVSIVINHGRSNSVTVTDLLPGTYTISEQAPTNGTTLVKVNDTKVTDDASKIATVTVNVDRVAQASFTNDKVVKATITVLKKWYDSNGNDVTSQFINAAEVEFELWQKTTYTAEGTYPEIRDRQYGRYSVLSGTGANMWKGTFELPATGTVEVSGTYVPVEYTYYLKEVKVYKPASEGGQKEEYPMTEYEVTYTATDKDGKEVISTEPGYSGAVGDQGSITMSNKSTASYALPETGGPGTGKVNILGSILILLGAGVLLLRRRKESL